MQIVKMVFGSRLYGTHTENSDTDYKSIFLPKIEDLVLGKVKHSFEHSTGGSHQKNTASDIDETSYSLHKFLQLAVNGDAVAMDMLHCENPLIGSEWWEVLRNNRHRFYTKNMKAYIGYVRKQAHKYGQKGGRVAALKEVIKVLSEWPDDIFLSAIQSDLPVNEFCQFERMGCVPFYSVLGKKYQLTNTVRYALQQLAKAYEGYGARARLAEQNEGVDWKAMHHALRVSYQLRDILSKGDFKYPPRPDRVFTEG